MSDRELSALIDEVLSISGLSTEASEMLNKLKSASPQDARGLVIRLTWLEEPAKDRAAYFRGIRNIRQHLKLAAVVTETSLRQFLRQQGIQDDELFEFEQRVFELQAEMKKRGY